MRKGTVLAGRSPLSHDRLCSGCTQKQLKIDRLEARVEQLEDQLRYQARTAKEAPFGSSTPSSKILIKANSLEDRQARKGGAKLGHRGSGRRDFSGEQADRVIRVKAPDVCPDCGGDLEARALRRRGVIDVIPLQVERQVLEVERQRCRCCKRFVDGRPSGVLPRFLYGNALLAHVAVQHYLYGQTLGLVARQLGLSCSSLLQALHALGRRMDRVIPKLVEQYRAAPVKHADETSWRTDGRNGYAWLFATTNLSIFRFRSTRAASVAKEIFGRARQIGVLVVDRYHGYNQLPCKIQYCFAHLLRNVKDLGKQFVDNPEVGRFVDTVSPLLAEAMKLRRTSGGKRRFLHRAGQLKGQIIDAMNAQAQHPAIQDIQRTFREKSHRLYHWARDPRIPADNNLAERDLRPLVIARKISFGSQSLAGARTRETLMSILHTLQKQSTDPAARFKSALDQLAQNPDLNLYKALFMADSS